MKVGIIVHSQSGNTADLAKHLADALKEHEIGYEIELLRTRTETRPFSSSVELRKVPELDEYDILCVGAPVWLLKPSKVILSFFNECKTQNGKKIIPFVTHSIPFKGLGAQQALKRMGQEIDGLLADPVEGESVFYLFKPNKMQLQQAIARIVEKIKNIINT